MSELKSPVGYWGIGMGAAALMLVLVHIWAGPFSVQPSLEQTVAEKAVAIRDATVAALKGEQVEQSVEPGIDLDEAVSVGGAVLGGLAVVLGVIGFARRESTRVVAGAAVLGAGAIAFQFAAFAVAAIFVAIIVAAVISKLSFDLG